MESVANKTEQIESPIRNEETTVSILDHDVLDHKIN